MLKYKQTCLLSFLISLVCHCAYADEQKSSTDKMVDSDDVMVITAAEQTRQALGTSIITQQDIKKVPPKNDLSEIIRTMPGVNLTGNSTSGQRGNNRQIDIRGMGPENTLILIDGKPVKSRMSVRYGWRGERDTRGDSNWVPADIIERIDVIRGPAAARYGDGAAGGVINIITKQPTNIWHGSLNSYISLPVHSEEGNSKRTDFLLTGGLTDNLSMRLYGNINKTDADDWDINQKYQINPTSVSAGREGVRNKDLNGLLRWDITDKQSLEFEAGISRQGNIYAGDTQNNNPDQLVSRLYNHETNRMYRQNYALTHRGYWDSGISMLSYIQSEKTRNSRLNEGLAGGTEGRFSDNEFSTIKYNNVTLHHETNLPLTIVVPQTVTVGAEYNHQRMKDPSSNTQEVKEGGRIPWIKEVERSEYSSANLWGVFIENNIELTSSTILTPALRFNYHSQSGRNWSPALNLVQELNDYLSLKLGIARAYKAPNLYQSNPNYLLYSRGQGCYGAGGSCYLIGNDHLKAETSVNKEIGLEFHDNKGIIAGVTYFRNDYRNKIESGITPIGHAIGGDKKFRESNIFQWQNVPKSVVDGVEGSLTVPVTNKINWRNNLTWMLQSKNKQTGDYLSIIPKYTLNSSFDWQATDKLSFLTSVTWYGKQRPKKYDYFGEKATNSSTHQLSPYSILNFSSQYQFNQNASLTLGVDNLLNKRLFREGNSSSLKHPKTGKITVSGAGAATYNEPGRTFFVSTSISF
ncbi:TonB-dependent siderophore receptor [Gilliamella sp. Pas-s95]|uniref:TonB-dependent siderophore receptor n=1 Tax=Gilliamella sp. Pas-s95 TaxID=2687317 RepID=UPI00132609B9|nr:TonB-dependent siderophore receptor [Gilliamella sp. Pas-s95]MWN05457.1 TonB-dependent siderophore receptor [Gilliamella sp. Pas-s95]